MSIIQQSYLQHLLSDCESFVIRHEKEARQEVVKRLDEIYLIFKSNIRATFDQISFDAIVRFTQIAVQLPDKFAYAQQFVELFFERVQAPSQFMIRALLVQAKVIAYEGQQKNLKGQEMMQTLEKAIECISRALDLSVGTQEAPAKGKDPKSASQPDSLKTRYGFFVYNASTCLYKIIRFMLRQSWQRRFTDIIERIYKLFEDLDEPDQSWRCRFSLIYFQVLYDAQKKPDAFKIMDQLWQRAKVKANSDMKDLIFRLRVHLSKENPALQAIIKKDVEGPDPQGWKVLEALQRIKSGAVQENQVEKELMSIVNQISLGVLNQSEQTANVLLSSVLLERLAEASRVALRFNIVSIGHSINSYLLKARQLSQKAYVLNEYSKAELKIKKKNQFIDKKTGLMMNPAQIKALEIENRKDALKILEKVMPMNKKLEDADLIYEGAILIWNISLPFMCPQYRQYISKAFEISVQLLEQIDSIDHDLRTKMHLELAKIYFGNDLMFNEVESNINKAIKLDHSIPPNKRPPVDPNEDASLSARPYQKYLEDFKHKILVKTMQTTHVDELDGITQALWNVADQKSETTRMDTLQKCIKTLLSCQYEPFEIDPEEKLVEEQIKERKIEYERKKLIHKKRKKLLAAEIAELGFEWELNDFSKKACQIVLEDKWEVRNVTELIIAQSKCCYFMGQILIEELAQQNLEVPYIEPKLIQEDERQIKQPLFQPKQLEQINAKKQQVFEYFSKGLAYASSIQQHWLVFNGAIYIWNKFLHVFRNPSNDPKLRPDAGQLLKSLFEAMKNSLKEIETKNIVYYDSDTKIQTYANIGLIYARLMECQKQFDEVARICEAFQYIHLPAHTRKLINTIKVKIPNSKAPAGQAKAADTKKGPKETEQKNEGLNESLLFDIISQLEIIQNSTNKSQNQPLIQRCFESLEVWKPKDKDEAELELHAQLWARLGRLALGDGNSNTLKECIKCVQHSLTYLNASGDLSNIPVNRLRWYSLAEFLYSEGLAKMVNPNIQEMETVEKLLFVAIGHAVEAAYKGSKSGISVLVTDAAKQVWNLCTKLSYSPKNRQKLLKPIYDTFCYLKEVKEAVPSDLIVLLSQLYFKVCLENNQYKQGEEVADMLFPMLPKAQHKTLWEAKMVFLSKQGKNELQAISNMKEADPSLQAKLWVKLARVSINAAKQQLAYNKAIDILKKQNSVQIVEVLIEYAQWQIRVGKQKSDTASATLLLASDYLIDIEFVADEEVEEDHATVFSKSTREKKSDVSKSIRSIPKDIQSKRAAEKRGPKSIKSSANSQSRMSRAGRASKTVKSKNVKSIFTQREEDPNPETLNCCHFERLFRIHTILAMIATNPNYRIGYALDAKYFLMRVYELALATINEMQESAAKFTEKNQQAQEYNPILKPATDSDWINLELPKEFIDRIKNLENSNFMGTSTFDKSELTFTYLRLLISTLEDYGLNNHTIPLYFFLKYLAKYIIEDEELLLIVSLAEKKNLLRIGHPKRDALNLQLCNLTIPQIDRKNVLIKTESMKANERTDLALSSNSEPPNLVSRPAKWENWAEIGKLLIWFGQIRQAKIYLTEALKNAKVAQANEVQAEICLGLANVAQIEGDDAQALKMAMEANKVSRTIKNWSAIVRVASKSFIRSARFNTLNDMLLRLQETTNDLLEGCRVQTKEKQAFRCEIIELEEILQATRVEVLRLKFIEAVNEANKEEIMMLMKALKQVEELLKVNEHWKLANYQALWEVLESIVYIYECGGGTRAIDFGHELFALASSCATRAEKSLFQTLKYTILVGSGESLAADAGKGMLQNQLNEITALDRRYRYLIVRTNVLGHQTDSLRVGGLDDEPNKLGDIATNYEPLKKFMRELTLAIQKKIAPLPVKLEPIEAALTILENLKSSLGKDLVENVKWSSEYSYCQTVRAIAKDQLKQMWNSVPSEEDFDYPAGRDSLIAAENYVNEFENKAENFLQNLKCYRQCARASQSILENRAVLIPLKYFEYLSKLQHYSYIESSIYTLRSKLSQNHRLNVVLRLLEETHYSPKSAEKLLVGDRLLNGFSKFPSFAECLALTPKRSLTVILQFSRNKRNLYFGCLSNEEDDEKKVIVLKKAIQKEELKKYLELQDTITSIKKTLAKTSFDNLQKQKELFSTCNLQLQKVMKQLTTLSNWWLKDLLGLINKPRQAPPADPALKDKKAPPKDAKKKGGKDQVSSYESPLTPTPSGHESLQLLLDESLYLLPFDHLPGLEILPAVARDNSFFLSSRKLAQAGFQSELNNSMGFGADKGKYIAYDFKDPNDCFKGIAGEIVKQSPSLKIQGLDSSTRTASIADFSRFLGETGYLHVYGPVDFLNSLKFSTLASFIKGCRSRLLFVTDSLNFLKSSHLSYFELDSNGFASGIEQDEPLLCLLANLSNMCLIKNRWTTTSTEMRLNLKQAYKTLGNGNYFGAVSRILPQESLMVKTMQIVHGPPVLRM